MMMIGQPGRWWNRSLPLFRIMTAGILLLLFAGVLVSNWNTASAVAWGLRHHWTAQVRGQSIPVPAMWSQEKNSRTWDTLVLHKARWFQPISLERISIRFEEKARSEAEVRATMENFRQILVRHSMSSEPFSISSQMDSQFNCLVQGRSTSNLDIVCTSLNGTFEADFQAKAEDLPAFRDVLLGAEKLRLVQTTP